MKTVSLPISKHPWRCIDTDGTQCPQLLATRLGTAWTCKLFCKQGHKGKWEPLNTRGGPLGCLEKHPECLKACNEK